MAKIHQLDTNTANKIAAGEVIERPANVIKECVENAIDAQATKIDVEVIEGGSVLMRITDNGIGMDKDDAQMCFARHATSKITDDHDLFNITTLGFRGEAIPSIASISLFTLETSVGDEKGTRVIYEFGVKKSVESCALNKGTRITVEKIFQNVPARLKYMKSVNTEFAAIYTYIERLSLAHPEIAFSLTHNGKMIYATNGQGKLLEVIATIYGLNIAKHMKKVDFGNEEFTITGYTSDETISRASKNHIITLVNHRYVKNKKSIDAINEVYRAYLMNKRYPITVINIEVDPYLVDVNVHPAKLEVRFSKESLLKEMITEGFNEVLAPQREEAPLEAASPKVSFAPKEVATQLHFKLPEAEETPSLIKKPETVYEEKQVPNIKVKEMAPVYQMPPQPTHQEEKKVLKPMKEKIYVKAQLQGSYIVGENEKGIYLIDQKRAMDNIAYEKYKEDLAQMKPAMQDLIVPLMFELPESEYLLLEEKKDDLLSLGIDLQPISKNTYCVRALPLWMDDVDEQAFIEDMIQVLITQDDPDLIALRDQALLSLAKHQKLAYNTHLSQYEMQSLVDELMRCSDPYRDLNKRQVIIFKSNYELMQLFKKG